MDQQILDFLPHRSPMLLIDKVVDVSEESSEAIVYINEQASFFIEDKGVPAWIGLEYMGQTAALMAGYQKQKGLVEPYVGFLLGSRKFTCSQEWFSPNSSLIVSAKQVAFVGNSLATFSCSIKNEGNEIASANLSVMRKPVE